MLLFNQSFRKRVRQVDSKCYQVLSQLAEVLNFDTLDILCYGLVDTGKSHGFFVGILSVSDVLVLEFFELCGDCESWASIVS